MWRRHRAAAMTPRFRHTHRVVRPHDPSRQASLRKHIRKDMGGDFIGRWRAGSGRRTARQAKPGQYRAKVLACGSLLLSCVIVAGMATQTALAQTAAPAATRVADNEKAQGGPGVAQASRRRSRNPKQSCDSLRCRSLHPRCRSLHLRCRSQRRQLPFKCRRHGNRARGQELGGQGFTCTTARPAGRSGEEDRPEDLAE